jgi:hypothetical protein
MHKAERNLLMAMVLIFLFLLLVNFSIIDSFWIIPFASSLMVLMSCSPFFDYLAGKCQNFFHKQKIHAGSEHLFSVNASQPTDATLKKTRIYSPILLHDPLPLSSSSIQLQLAAVTHKNEPHHELVPPVIQIHPASDDSLSPSSIMLPGCGENWRSSSNSTALSLISFGGSFSWMCYGCCIQDPHIAFPNGFATLLSILQLILIARPDWAPESPIFYNSFL